MRCTKTRNDLNNNFIPNSFISLVIRCMTTFRYSSIFTQSCIKTICSYISITGCVPSFVPLAFAPCLNCQWLSPPIFRKLLFQFSLIVSIMFQFIYFTILPSIKWSCHGMVSEIVVQFVNVNVFDSYLSTYLAEWAIQTKKFLVSIYLILKLSGWKLWFNLHHQGSPNFILQVI